MSKTEDKSAVNDILVNVDNFVEIGDFFAIFIIKLKKIRLKPVEKSINGFWFIKKVLDWSI